MAERVTVEDYTLNPHPVQIDLDDPDLVQTASGEVIRVLKRLEHDAVRKQLQRLFDDGFRSLAVGFLHSYLFPGASLWVFVSFGF